ncbi:MAG TPA: ABC transporter permease [Geomonas sp.]
MEKIGVGSLFIIILTGFFTGMVMALQALLQLKPVAGKASFNTQRDDNK